MGARSRIVSGSHCPSFVRTGPAVKSSTEGFYCFPALLTVAVQKPWPFSAATKVECSGSDLLHNLPFGYKGNHPNLQITSAIIHNFFHSAFQSTKTRNSSLSPLTAVWDDCLREMKLLPLAAFNTVCILGSSLNYLQNIFLSITNNLDSHERKLTSLLRSQSCHQ